ncbi:hypothetical protein [Pseudovibrio sp. JE062]|uniref:hypothetical protein n=1 Tax=Pseudovibrio sp. JE062 TaxID=439495 RepID=UPI000186F678|nr:hypothetical protein [Pseudovibrio sp. JE062]EEA93453.1 hypothetical protein PJE062_3853 [Pseudovibrio sp. JE062]
MKKVLIHIGAHTTGSTALQQQLYAKDPERFVDPAHFENSRFMKLYEDRLIKPKASQLAELFQEAVYRPDMETYRLSCERLMGRPFQKGGFYPHLKRYVQLVEGLQRADISVKTLVVLRERTDFLISCFLQSQTGYASRNNFHEFANLAVTDAFSWQAIANQLDKADTTFVPWEAAETKASELAGQFNQFFELKLLGGEDLTECTEQPQSDPGLSVIQHLAKIEDEGLRAHLMKCAAEYCRQSDRAAVISEDLEGIYRRHFLEGDIAFAKANYPSPFRKIYSQTKSVAEQFWFAFATDDA